ncbi:MAG: heat-shock protein Hsp70 [Spirochaetaceae bacterium]|nr:MAG: heat-shock protein Hsp70 [Spirochaetaceae bacterium]
MARIIGIDLGTTNTVVAVMEGGEARVIPNDRGSRLTPSVVAFAPGGDVLVGESARNQAVVNAARTVAHVKRKMGQPVATEIDGTRYSPEAISAFILAKVKRDAEQYLGEEVREAVIAVPANFSDKQRKATVEAGRLAGLTVLRIMNEPTAAALAYGVRGEDVQRIVVYDLGGGTFDATCLEAHGANFTVKASRGHSHLGGIDFDRVLADRVLAEFRDQSGFDCSGDPVLLQQVYELVERTKIELSTRNDASCALPFIAAGAQSVHLQFQVTREEFDHLIEDRVQESVALTQSAVADAGFDAAGIDALVLSGGSSRIPLVHTMLREALGVNEVALVNPDEIVALGAAVQAHALAQSEQLIHLRDVVSYSLGVEIDNGRFVSLLPKNTQIPVETTRVFTTVSDNQDAVEIHVLQGEHPEAARNESLGRFLLTGIREGVRGEPRIEVIFSVDADGIAHVGAHDVDTGARQTITVHPVPDDDGDTSRQIQRSVESLIDRTINQRRSAASTVDAAFAKEIEDLVAHARRALSRDDVKTLRECRLALETVIDELSIQAGGGLQERYEGA